MNTSLCRTVQ